MSEALESIAACPLQFVVNTHWHFDHTDGNEWMNAAGATIVAHTKTQIRMEHDQAIPEFEGVYPPSPSDAQPSVTFKRNKALEVNCHKLELTRYTPAHTDSDISVYFIGADVLHTGDTFSSDFYPFIDYSSRGSIDGMITACHETLSCVGPSTIIICGHGSASRRGDLVDFQRMLIDVRADVSALKEAGASPEEVIARSPTASYDAIWDHGFVSPDLFTWLVYRGV
jgi:glyoxylase-like metal-dependent hydrolase (beta-lactamase superfamily II)